MFKFSLKTKIRFYVSCGWLLFAFFVATTYSKLNNQIIVSWFDFYNVYWHIFFIVGIPVWLYWIAIRPYKWIKKMRSNSEKTMKLKIGIFQYEMKDESPDDKINRLENHLKKNTELDLVICPELFISGYGSL